MHASDISNGLKDYEICFEWSNRVMNEFWNQVK